MKRCKAIFSVINITIILYRKGNPNSDYSECLQILRYSYNFRKVKNLRKQKTRFIDTQGMKLYTYTKGVPQLFMYKYLI